MASRERDARLESSRDRSVEQAPLRESGLAGRDDLEVLSVFVAERDPEEVVRLAVRVDVVVVASDGGVALIRSAVGQIRSS